MNGFTDGNGLWRPLVISIGDVRRVKRKIGVDLMQADNGTLLASLAEDPVKLLEVISCIMELDSEAETALFESINGPAIVSAIDGFVEALIDFFLQFRPTAARSMASLWKRFQQIQEKSSEAIAAKLDGPQMDELIRAEMEKSEAAIDQALSEALGI